MASGKSDLDVRYTLGAYTEGTLAIDLRGPSTRSLVWPAIAREEKSNAAKIEDRLVLDGAVDRM